MICRTPIPNIGDELHHFGWNACSSCHTDASKSRRFLIVPCLRFSRIHILDTADPRDPRLEKVIEPDEVSCQRSQSLLPAGSLEKFSEVGALQQGLRLGVDCVGSCWPLMLLMFAVGHHRLDWMLALGGIMAAERLTPWGYRLAWLVGLVLIVWATLWVLALQHSGHSYP